jgi:hypothetical protein
MKIIFKNKKGIAPIVIMLMFVLVLIAFYFILFLPIPAFTKLRVTINYFMIIIFWFLLQGILIYGYYKLGTYFIKGIRIYKSKVMDWTMNIRDYIIVHT